MRLAGVKIGFVMTGSHCTIPEVLPEVEKLITEGAEIIPIFSYTVNCTDTRFGKAEQWRKWFEGISGRQVIASIVDAEPIGPQKLLDLIVVAPCTGTTLAKLANGIIDTPALMAIKAHLRNQRPVVIAISTNDGLGLNARNLGILMNLKNIYFVPFGQDNPQEKANSLVAHMDLIVETTILALQGKQIQPILISPKVHQNSCAN
ncbi:MAG: dipicolinate synthase subunit B [Firmicutes bacterium]|nr:dipicolinate synthase subunit B [Bacillota bacterium]